MNLMISVLGAAYFYEMKRILVIEDDAAIRENTAELLSLRGFQVETAENGSSGYMSAVADQPDLIICDMMMPETDGRGFLALARKNAKIASIPIVFFSAGTVSLKEQKYLIDNSAGFLRKPFSAEDLIAVVGKVLTS
jgi:CRP/FNR family cyclic AMP-dependent transcriptional regulator